MKRIKTRHSERATTTTTPKTSITTIATQMIYQQVFTRNFPSESKRDFCSCIWEYLLFEWCRGRNAHVHSVPSAQCTPRPCVRRSRSGRLGSWSRHTGSSSPRLLIYHERQSLHGAEWKIYLISIDNINPLKGWKKNVENFDKRYHRDLSPCVAQMALSVHAMGSLCARLTKGACVARCVFVCY